ncbi:MAG: hypothetical protein M5U01_30665 [Ardenticatenaceae bacterium]|nr:hypothetical protein [Ardenticatenaceae bacterium]
MDPKAVCCPTLACPARGQVGRGNIVIHRQKEQRYKWQPCGRTFAATSGTAFYRLRPAVDLVVMGVTLVASGCPIQAIVIAFGLDERTGRAWVRRAGPPCERVPQQLVVHPRDLGQVQADELCVKQQGQRVWLASAIQVRPRLGLGGVIRTPRDRRVIALLVATILVATIRACALGRPLVIAVDGVRRSVSAIQAACRAPIPTGRRGRPRLRPWNDLCVGQVIKHRAGRRVVSATRRIVQGRAALGDRLIRQTQGHGGLNTASLERMGATFRARLAALGRRTRALAHQTVTLAAGMDRVGTISNFCTDHESLRLEGLIGGRKWLPRTPARATGITDHRWSVQARRASRVPPPRCTPPTRRGRLSNEMKRLIAQWCS